MEYNSLQPVFMFVCVCLCVCVCLSVCEHISWTMHPSFIKCLCMLPSSVVLLWRCCNTLMHFRFLIVSWCTLWLGTGDAKKSCIQSNSTGSAQIWHSGIYSDWFTRGQCLISMIALLNASCVCCCLQGCWVEAKVNAVASETARTKYCHWWRTTLHWRWLQSQLRLLQLAAVTSVDHLVLPMRRCHPGSSPISAPEDSQMLDPGRQVPLTTAVHFTDTARLQTPGLCHSRGLEISAGCRIRCWVCIPEHRVERRPVRQLHHLSRSLLEGKCQHILTHRHQLQMYHHRGLWAAHTGLAWVHRMADRTGDRVSTDQTTRTQCSCSNSG